MDDKTMMLLLIPVVLIQLVLMIINLVNLGKKTKTKYLTKIVWIFIVILGGYVGNICYLILEGEHNDSD